MSKANMQIRGTVQSFNLSPKGCYEGLLLKTPQELMQVNFSKEWSASMSEMAPPGSEIAFDVQPMEPEGRPAHPVFQLIAIAGAGKFSGKIERLNYALHGEVNGAILTNGDFVHTKPHGAATLQLKAGMKVEGHGESKPAADGHRIIEAEEVNGLPLEKKPKPKKKAPHK